MTWIQTSQNVAFPLLDPRPEHIEIDDIALALSRICRFTGHTSQHYSVGQHSVLASHDVPRELALVALLHDAAETYLGDVSSPLKKLLGPMYAELERRAWHAIAAKFGVDPEDIVHVKGADRRLFLAERRDLMPESGADASGALPERIEPWTAEEAEAQFRTRLAELTD